jgi:flagellar hook-associated protein 2
MATNALFNGTSRFSNDFTQVITRSVAIASLPLTQMQQQRAKSSDESTALKTIEAKVLALQGVLTGIEGSLGARSSQTSSSDTAIVWPSSTDGVAEGSYTLQVNKLGVFSTAVSVIDPDPANNISDPGAGSFVTPGSTQLTVTLKDWDSGVTSVLDPATISGSSLQDVANLINDKFGTKVKAAIVNLGTTDDPNYQLSLQSLTLGKIAIQVNDGTRDLMNTDVNDNADPSLGELAEYKVNGATVKTNTRTITIAPKLTANLVSAQPGKDVTVSVSRTAGAFKTSLTSFISSFNTVMGELDQQSSGTLRGNSILSTIRQQLRAAVTGPLSGFGSMANIGLEFTKDGQLSLNCTLFDQATAGQLDNLKTAIGSATTSGFLKLATDTLNTIEGATDGGILKSTIQTVDDSVKAQDDRIASQQLRIDQLTTDLQSRMAAADALIAQMEQQATYITNMFEAMSANQKSYS